MSATTSKGDVLFRRPRPEPPFDANGTFHGATALATGITRQQIDELDEPRRAGLLLLLRGHEFADDLGRSEWDFALEIAALTRLGLSRMDLRWLVLKGYLTHATEVTRARAAEREFSPSGRLSFSTRTCFLLTPLGAAMARALRDSLKSAPTPPATAAKSQQVASDTAPGEELQPFWDCDRRELRLAGRIIKQFKVRSPNQETVLMAFQEEGWPSRIDDPLPGHPEMDAKQRLHDTIRSLNRNQKERLIRFKGDGKGEGVIWERTGT